MYHSLLEFETGLHSLASAYPDTCRLFSLPHVTVEGRTVWGVRLGTDGDRPGVLFWGGIHAREWMPPEICFSLLTDLLEAHDLNTGLTYGPMSYTSAQVRQIMETYHLYFVPVSNPDGHVFSKATDLIGGSGGWRRNRNPAQSGGNRACVGVDLNRNFDWLFDFPTHMSPAANLVNISTDPCNGNQVYHGPAPNSEQETKNLISFLDDHPQVRFFFDIHSYRELVLYSWGDDNSQTTDASQTFTNTAHDGQRGINNSGYAEFIDAPDLALEVMLSEEIRQGIVAVRGHDYDVQESFGLYPTTGTTTDYVYARHIVSATPKIHAFTLETGTSFRPLWPEAAEVVREVSSGLLRFLVQAPCLTWPITVTPPAALEIDFKDVSEGLTTYRAIVFQVRGCGPAELRIVDGPDVLSGPPGTSFGTPAGLSSGLVDPRPEVEVAQVARVWISYTGTSAGDAATGTVRVRCDATDQEWDVAISANTVPRPTAAVALALDQSDSMDEPAGDTGARRVDVLREAAGRFVELIPAGSAAGVVRFDHDAYPGHPMTHVASDDMGDAGRQQLWNAVMAHSFNPNGFTSIGDGVVLARNLLPATGYQETALIVFTDGIENREEWISDVLGSIDERTFAIGLGTETQVSTSGLMALAGVRQGYLLLTGHLTPGTDDHFRLTKYFHQILAGVTRTSIVADPSGELRRGSVHRIPFDLTEADVDATVIALVDRPGLDVRLETPAGDLVDPATAAGLGATFNVGTNMSYYRFGLPLPIGAAGAHAGTWHAVLRLDEGNIPSGDDVGLFAAAPSSRSSIRYNLSVHSYSNLTMTATADQDSLEPGARVTLSAMLREYDVPHEGRAVVTVEIERPDGSIAIIALAETEQSRYEADTVVTSSGLYRLLFTAIGTTRRGRPFTREHLATVAVFRGGDDPLPGGEGGTGAALPDGCCGRLLRCLLDACRQWHRVLRRQRPRLTRVARAARGVAGRAGVARPGQQPTAG